MQPEVNIALVGHVDHGKTTLTERLSGKWTDTHSEELKRGITIRLGYADTTFVKTKEGYSTLKLSPKGKILRKMSFVDAPGHESLMATMLSGAAIVDGALLLIAANEKCPQAQTAEHLTALEIAGIKNVIIVQNKIDLVDREQALKNYEQVRKFLKGTPYENAPVVPISARQNINVDSLIESIEKHIPTPERKVDADPLMLVARSFDVNKPGTTPKKMIGGVLGGTVKEGTFSVGDTVEIVPGYMVEERNKKIWKPIQTTITKIFTGGEPIDKIQPGGSMAFGTTLDPAVVKSDMLTGSLIGLPGKLPEVRYNLVLETHLLKRMVGNKDDIDIKPLAKKEMLMMNVHSCVTVGVITDPSKKKTSCILKKPVAARIGDRVTLSRRVGDRFRLIGYGIIKG